MLITDFMINYNKFIVRKFARWVICKDYIEARMRYYWYDKPPLENIDHENYVSNHRQVIDFYHHHLC